MNIVTFSRDTDAQGFGLFLAALERNDIVYTIDEEPTRWIVKIIGHKL